MSNHICPKCETAVIAAWRQEIDGNYYHDRCLPFRGLLNHAESELTAANARIAALEAIEAKLADCQAVIRHKGHDVDCPVTQCCKVCGTPKMWTAHRSIFDDYPEYHEFEPGPCSDACGHDRTTGEKA